MKLFQCYYMLNELEKLEGINKLNMNVLHAHILTEFVPSSDACMLVLRKRIREDPLTNIRITNTRGGVQLTKDLLLLGFHHWRCVLQLGEEGRQIADTPRGPRVTP